MYYLPAAGGSATSAKTTSLPAVPGSVSVAVADVVKNVFSGTNEVGTVQFRSKDADKLAVAATVLTPNNPAGVFGNTIPIMRSDRAAGTGNTIVLTGLRKDANPHTNLYIQETAGSPATVSIDYFAADGTKVSSSSPQSVDTFKLLQMREAVPTTADAAVITSTSPAGGKISAYATPVDQASTDTWAVADWSKQYAYSGSDPVIIPIAGSVHGANSTFYRTDVSITNRGSSQATGTLRYVSRAGDKIDQPISLAANATQVISDAVGSFFNVSADSTGYLIFTPASGSSAPQRAALSETIDFFNFGRKPAITAPPADQVTDLPKLASGGHCGQVRTAHPGRTCGTHRPGLRRTIDWYRAHPETWQAQ